MKPTDEFFNQQQEPHKSCFLALRHILLSINEEIEEAWKYRLPFYLYRGKPLAYFWMEKKNKHPYIGFVKGAHLHHHLLDQGTRKKMKILQLNPHEDIPADLIRTLIKESLLYF